MYPGDLLYSLLTAHADVMALVGGRVYPVKVPQGKPLPAVVYQQISGPSGRCASYDRLRYQLSLYTTTYTQAQQLSLAVRQCLDGYEEGETSITLDQEIDQFSEPADAYFRTQDYLLDFPNPLSS